MTSSSSSMDFNYSPKQSFYKSIRFQRIILGMVVLGALGFGIRWAHHVGSATITVVNRIAGLTSDGSEEEPKNIIKISDDPEYTMPDKDNKRLDILVLGIRGKDDVENGGLLTDTILLFSMDADTGAATLTSIPRDLTVRVTDTKIEKINTAYIYNGVGATKKLYSRILGVQIDSIVVVDFSAFKYIVDTLGGITITLDKPFEEPSQWGYAFQLPAGTSTLNGDQALYYARSRYGSSDFDRSRRQMQIISAIKAKVDGLNLTSDPLKALELITTVRKHIDTDMNIFDIGTLKDLIQESDQLAKIKRYQLTTENLLYETKVDGIYELLPRGDTLAHIKEFFQTVLTDHPVISAPSPSPSPTP